MDRLEQSLAVAAPPALAEAARAAGCPPEGVRALERDGPDRRPRSGPRLRQLDVREIAATALALARRAPLTPAALRDATGTSRKYVMAILADLDRRGILRRTPDGHLPGPTGCGRDRRREPAMTRPPSRRSCSPAAGRAGSGATSWPSRSTAGPCSTTPSTPSGRSPAEILVVAAPDGAPSLPAGHALWSTTRRHLRLEAGGLKQLRAEVGKGAIGQGITQLHGKNPLPLAVVVHPDNANNLRSIQNAIVPPGPNGKPKPISPAIEEVNNGQKAADTIRTVTNAVKIILSVIAVLLLIISLMLIANTIRLSIYARRREVEVMRLVGATNWFIRWPFVIEGLIVGLAGAGIAVAMLWVGKVTIIDPLSQNFALIDNFSTVGFVPLIIVLLGASVVVSMIGSGIVLRRFLRI